MTIGAGLVERGEDDRIYNSYVVAMPDGTWAVHRKLHVFEHANISAGDRYTVFDTPHGCRVGVLICYDNNIVENARATALLGAEILLAPHQTGGCNSVSPRGMKPVDHAIWERRVEDPAACEAELCGPKGRGWLMRWLPSRAHDNGMFLLFSNGVGPDDDEIRTGNAMVLDPYGEIVAETRAAGDAMVVADLDASQTAHVVRTTMDARAPAGALRRRSPCRPARSRRRGRSASANSGRTRRQRCRGYCGSVRRSRSARARTSATFGWRSGSARCQRFTNAL